MPRPDLGFERTPARIRFQLAAGHTNRFLNTLLVSLETLKVTPPIVPADLVVPWSQPANATEWSDTRDFALKGAMIALVDGLDQYMRVLSRLQGVTPPTLDNALNGRKGPGQQRRPTISERLEELAAAYSGVARSEHVSAMHLLVLWRNGFVHHDYRFGLSRTQRQALVAAAGYFKQVHGGTDMLGALSRFESRQAPRLSDLSTLIASAHRLVEALDTHILHIQTPRDYALALMRFLISESPDPAAFIDEVWEYDSHTAVGSIHALFLANGANHAAARTASAPTVTAADMIQLFSYGRNQAGIVFNVTLAKRPVPVGKRRRRST